MADLNIAPEMGERNPLTFEKALTAKPEFSGVSGHMVGETGANPVNSLGDVGAARVLVACEYSGAVRDAFLAIGFDAWSCDILPSESRPDRHIQGDALEVIYGQHLDCLIGHPPCTYLSRAGARWWGNPERDALADAAAEFVFKMRDAPVRHIAIENPIGQLNKRWRYPDQIIQPWEYGHPFSKATCLWLKNLPPLMPTAILANYRPLIRSNVTARKRAGKPQMGVLSGGLESARTFSGIATAMADQWGHHLTKAQRIAA